MRKRLIVLGVPIDPMTMSETLDRILEMVRIGRATGKVHQVATVNVDFVVQALYDPELRYLLQRADLLTADGMPIVWGVRWLGVAQERRVAGADLVPALVERAAECGFSIFFLGGAPGVAVRAAGLLKQKYPALKIAGIYAPPYSPLLDMDTSFLEEIRAASPDILLVGFGNPKQEKWFGLYGRGLGVPVIIGVGGTLNFIAGYIRRAPVWMQRNGFEWLFRLMQEPRRLYRRYLMDLIYFPFFLRQWCSMCFARGSSTRPAAAGLELIQGQPLLNLRGCLTKDHLEALQLLGKQALAISPDILVNLGGAVFLDCFIIGALLDLGNQARFAGGELVLATVPASILHSLTLLKMEKIFPIYQDIQTYMVDRISKNKPVDAKLIPDSSTGPSWMVLRANRVLDSSTSQDLIDAGTSLLDKTPYLICDLVETVFLTSAGLVALNQLRQMAVDRKGKFGLINCSPDILHVIKVTHSAHVPSLYSNFFQAVV